MNNENKYNGYENYETWAVALWLNNEESTYRYWRELACEEKREAPRCREVKEKIWPAEKAARFRLAARLKEEVCDEAPELGACLYSDLLGSALDSVNWHEVAECFLEE